jgi:hypothetical protein
MPTTLHFRSRASTQIKADSRDYGTDRSINRDLLLVLGFCALGLVIMLNVMLRFPDLGTLIERYNQF